jgi:hypothetical protein
MVKFIENATFYQLIASISSLFDLITWNKKSLLFQCVCVRNSHQSCAGEELAI